ncbi:hypothetical protein [Bradyrhizobium sp. DASA03007]|uniref:hypothetical protein n=1 Tax=unclassified Bradyrhizobium TaxID=2631580 RepID=UPI003F70E4B6
MDPTANDPFRYRDVADQLVQQEQPAPVVLAEAPIATTEVLAQAVVNETAVIAETPAFAPEAPLNGEIIPPAPETPPSVPQYPIGLIDFNQPFVVVDHDEYSISDDKEPYDSSQIVTILKGSLYPVAISFWKDGEQCLAQFDTDGNSSCGDFKVEQDLIYPATRFVVIGRDGRNLVVDEELYLSEDAARGETDVKDIAGIFPVLIEAPKAAEPAPVVTDVAGAGSVHDGIDGQDEAEEHDDEQAPAIAAPAIEAAPTEMYVASRMRRVGETVHAYRQGFGVRVCTIVKMRRDSRKSLYLDPKDGNGPYWALNKNVRY